MCPFAPDFLVCPASLSLVPVPPTLHAPCSPPVLSESHLVSSATEAEEKELPLSEGMGAYS